MAYRLYVVVIEIDNERSVVVRMVLGTDSRCSIVPSSSSYGSLVEGVDCSSILGDEGDVELGVFYWCFSEPEFWFPVLSESAPSHNVHERDDTKRSECSGIKGFAFGCILDRYTHVIDNHI